MEGAGPVRDGAAGVRGPLDGGVRGIVLAAGVTAFGLLAGAGARGPVLAGVGLAAAALGFAGAGLAAAALGFAGAGLAVAALGFAGAGLAAAAPGLAGAAGLGAPVAPLSFGLAGCLAGADFFAGEDRDFLTEDLPGLTSCSSVHSRPALSITDGRRSGQSSPAYHDGISGGTAEG